MKIQIKSIYSGSVIFEAEVGSMRLCVEAAVVSSANLYRANLSGADLSGADLSGANLYRANLYRANLYSANLYRANLSGADLSGADLSGANLYRANLYRANLYRANLYRANLSGADLSGADLSGANLYRANLYRANLYRANLSGADLSGADLSGANLYRANLYRANLYRAKGIDKYKTTTLLMLYDQPGPIRAYKLVNSEGEGPQYGGLKYKTGKVARVNKSDCETREDVQCGAGVNVATLDWCMREWFEGCKILVVEFTAKDICAIPTATDGKFRLYRCRVVGEKDLTEIGLVQ